MVLTLVSVGGHHLSVRFHPERLTVHDVRLLVFIHPVVLHTVHLAVEELVLLRACGHNRVESLITTLTAHQVLTSLTNDE